MIVKFLRRSYTTGAAASPSISYPTVSDLFSKSSTCWTMTYKDKKIFLLGDQPSCPIALERIKYTINTLKPATVLIEAENPFLGRDDNKINSKDAKWRRPNPSGTLILDSYRDIHADYYPNLSQHLENYTPDNKQSHILQIRTLLEDKEIPVVYCGVELSDTLERKSKAGQLEELTVQFREQFLRAAKRQKEKRDEKFDGTRQQASMFGAFEGLDEKEQREQIELTKLVVEDLTGLSDMFVDDRLLNAEQFKTMMNACNNLQSINDYELFSKRSLVRNAGLNQTIRSLDFDYAAHAMDFWNAMKLLMVNRDRLLLRMITEKVDEMVRKDEKGTVLACFNFMHIHGIQTMWQSTKFWKEEDDTKEYIKELDQEWIERDLAEGNAPFFGNKDPARDEEVKQSDDGLKW